MGQAFDKYGRLLGEAEGDTRGEVLDALEREHPEAAEIRIRQLESRVRQLTTQIGACGDTPITVADLREAMAPNAPQEDPK